MGRWARERCLSYGPRSTRSQGQKCRPDLPGDVKSARLCLGTACYCAACRKIAETIEETVINVCGAASVFVARLQPPTLTLERAAVVAPSGSDLRPPMTNTSYAA